MHKAQPRVARFGVVLFLATFVLSSEFGFAECLRPPPAIVGSNPNGPPDLDGPGSFGPLQDTVTLDCLHYVRSFMKRGIVHVVIQDELKQDYVLKLGSFIGENSGVLIKMDSNYLYIEQVVQENQEKLSSTSEAKWKLVVVKFPKHPKK